MSSNLLKIVIINATKYDLRGQFESNISYFEYDFENNLFTREQIALIHSADFIFVVCDSKETVINCNVKMLLDTITDNDICIYQVTDKPLDEIVLLYNDISNLMNGSSLINIEIEDLKGYNITESFCVTNKNEESMLQDFEKELTKYIDVVKYDQVAIIVVGGYEMPLPEINKYIDVLTSKLSPDTNVLFGSVIESDTDQILRISCYFQQTQKISLKDEIKNKKTLCASMLQRHLCIGYQEACKIRDDLVKSGSVSKTENTYIIIDEDTCYNQIKSLLKDTAKITIK